MSVLEDFAELLQDTQAEEDLVFIGLKNQPVLLPSKGGGRTAKRNIHFIRRHSKNLRFGLAVSIGVVNG